MAELAEMYKDESNQGVSLFWPMLTISNNVSLNLYISHLSKGNIYFHNVTLEWKLYFPYLNLREDDWKEWILATMKRYQQASSASDIEWNIQVYSDQVKPYPKILFVQQ